MVKNLLLGFLIVLFLTISVGENSTLVAKPAYCQDAYNKCLDRCRDLYNSDLSRSGCYFGCYLAYLFCGV